MVKSVYIKVLSFAVALLVFVSSIGLTINAHYCHTTGAFKKSMLPIVELHCADDYDGTSCAIAHHHEENSTAACCQASAPANTTHDDDCCEDYTSFFKLLSDFDLPTVKVSFNLFVKVMVAILEFLTPSGIKESSMNSANTEPPPVFYGKQLLLAFNQLKIPSPTF